MLQERYVSFEIAKLLKEKGFDVPCCTYWEDAAALGIVALNKAHVNFNFKYSDGWDKDKYLAPTHQMALEWLREKIFSSFPFQPISPQMVLVLFGSVIYGQTAIMRSIVRKEIPTKMPLRQV